MRRSSVLSLIALLAALPSCRESGQATPDQARAAGNADAPAASTGAGGTAAAAGAARGTVPMEMSVMVGGKSYRASGNGECQHAPVAAIYGNPAMMWRAGYSAAENADIPYLALTVWRPTGGSAEQFTLGMRVGSESYDVTTVQGSRLVGKGSAAVRNAGAGGRLEVKGQDAGGTDLSVTVSCVTFTEAIAEGG